MNLALLFERFAESRRQLAASTDESHLESINLLLEYLSEASHLPSTVTPMVLRDFLGRWLVERASASAASPPIDAIVDLLVSFVEWAGAYTGEEQSSECLPVLNELKVTVPRALEVGACLSSNVARRGGAFAFPEFLTTFAEGGQSQYDITVAGQGGGPGAIEGYFRIVHIDGTAAEAEDLISGERCGPIDFPQEVARLLEPDFIINLEIVRSKEGWEIAASGCAYPPGTSV